MSRTNLIAPAFAALILIAATPSARAAVYFYNEATSGDLPGSVSGAATITPNPLVYGDRLIVSGTLNGTVGSQNYDGQDDFRFTLASQGRIDVSSLTLGTASGLVIFLYTIVDNQISDGFSVARVDNSSNNQNLFGFLSPGTYALALVPNGNSGTLSYTASVTGVPEPSSLVLCGLAGVVGLSFVRVRRRAA